MTKIVILFIPLQYLFNFSTCFINKYLQVFFYNLLFSLLHIFLSELGERDKRELIKYYDDIDDDNDVDAYLESKEDNGEA